MSFSVIIPARYASTRLPGKPLRDIVGKSMIQRVHECALQSDAKKVIIATDDERIFSHAVDFGAEVCMTSEHHESGTDRLQEVVQEYTLAEDEIVVNVQGDEPLIPAAVINQVADNLAQHAQASCATLQEKLTKKEDYHDPNVVKVVSDAQGMALYFSRAPIPHSRVSVSRHENLPQSCYRHIGIYAYRVSLLNQFILWQMSLLESIEKLEQLRILENAHKIHIACACERVPGGVDTEEDLQALCNFLSEGDGLNG